MPGNAEPGKPKLLTGGNPQIPRGERDEPVQAHIAAMPCWKRDLGRRLDERLPRSWFEQRSRLPGEKM